MGTAIEGALSAEEKPILENIVSLIQQLLSMEGASAEAAPEPETLEETIDKPEDETVDVTKAEGETGDSDAEERIDEQTETTEYSMSDLGKSINKLNLLLGKKTVKKSAPAQSPVMKELKKINDVLAIVVKNQQNQDKLNEQLFESIGITDEVIKKSLDANEAKDKPIQNTDTTKVVKEVLVEVLKSIPALTQNQEYRHPFNQKREARKDMSGILEHIHYGNK